MRALGLRGSGGVAAALLAVLFAVGVASAQTPGGDGQGPVAVTGHAAAISEANSLIAHVDVRLSGPARVLVEYWSEGAERLRTRLSEAAVEHRIPVVRLLARTTYRYAIGVEAPDGAIVFERGNGGEFTTGELPEELAALEWSARGRSTQALIMGDFRLYLLIWDDLGRIVWHHESPPGGRRVGTVRLRPDGNFLYASWPCCLREITPFGEIVGEYRFPLEGARPHHDFLVREDGKVLAIGRYEVPAEDPPDGVEPGPPILVDTLYLWDLDEERAELVWDSSEFWEVSPETIYTHANSVQIAPGGQVIMSFRHRNQAIGISPDFEEIEWRLGGPGSDYALADDDVFWKQHTPLVLANGNVLLFDNGNQRPGTSPWPEDDGMDPQWSRAMEFRLEDETMTATKVWEFRPEPDRYGAARGSAQRLANGNTLVNFGSGGMIAEADAEGNEVFRLTVPNDDEKRQYRAYGDIASIAGETRVASAAELRDDLGGSGADRSATWGGAAATSASALLRALGGTGVRSLHMREGAEWRRWATSEDGRPVPGSGEFEIEPGGEIWLGG